MRLVTALIFGLFLILVDLQAVDFHDFDLYQDKFTREEVESKIKTFLEKDAKISSFYRLTPQGLYIGDLKREQTDYVLRFARSPSPAKGKMRPSLQKAKIAIDPGHFGGLFAKLEERYVPIQNSKSIAFDEGTLTYLTALELKSLLEAEGAEVLISRSGIGQGALKETFFEWLHKNPQLWDSQQSLAQMFRQHYNHADLIARAEKINAFSPDLTIIIHYNAYHTEEEKEEKAFLTQANFNLVFIPGAFCANELNRAEDRYEFLRMIVTDDMQQSLELSAHIANQFTQHLKVPLITEKHKASYIANACLKHDTGIYSRNLALTRLVHSPLCYGETLIQNNELEVRRLSTNDTKIAGRPCPSRIKEVAEAYFDGIKSYFNTP